MINLDSRYFSKLAFDGLDKAKKKIKDGDLGKASSAAQSITAYISTWGLHRLGGDYLKYQKRGEATAYRGHIYGQFLETLLEMSPVKFDPQDPSTLIKLESLQDYTSLNRLAIALAKEWSFWAVPVLGEAKEE